MSQLDSKHCPATDRAVHGEECIATDSNLCDALQSVCLGVCLCISRCRFTVQDAFFMWVVMTGMLCWHAGGTCGSGSAAQRAEPGKLGTSDLARCQRERCRQAHAAQQHFAA